MELIYFFGFRRFPGQMLSFSFFSLGRSTGSFHHNLGVLPALLLLVLCINVSGGPAMAETEGESNNFFGTHAGESTKGNFNSFFGGFAGIINSTGYGNSFFGFGTGYYNSDGEHNSFFGADAGHSNTTGDNNSIFGKEAGFHNTVENYNTFVGYKADLNPGSNPATNPVTNATAIGYRAYVSQSNSLVLGSIKGVHDAVANVNVGIGISAPARQLHLKGDNVTTDDKSSLNTGIKSPPC